MNWKRNLGAGLVALMLSSAPAIAETVTLELEGESYSCGVGDIGGYDFYFRACGGASGGGMLGGLDWAGEWVGYYMTLPEDNEYRPFLCMQSDMGTVSTLRMKFVARGPDPRVVESVFQFTGQGIGCGLPFIFHEGNALITAAAGDYTVKIDLISAGTVCIDVVRLQYDATPTETGTWSRLKALYRD